MAKRPRKSETPPTATRPALAVRISPASQSPTRSWAIPAYRRIPAEIESRIPIERMVEVPLRLKLVRTAMPCDA